MPLSYWNGASTLPLTEESSFNDVEVLLYDPRRERGSRRVGDRLRQLDGVSWHVDLVIIRGATDLYDDLCTDGALQAILADVPTFALCPPPSGAEPAPRLIQPPWAVTPAPGSPVAALLAEPATLIETLRESEIESLLRRTGAVWSDAREHYALPSGLHASAFIRIAEALQDTIDVSRIADWLVPYVTPSSVILGDTGSILPVLLQVRLAVRDRFGWTPHVDTLPEYPRAPEDLTEVLQEVLTHRAHDPDVVFVSSVTSSGNLIRAVANLMPPDVPLRAVAICDTTPRDEVNSVRAAGSSADIDTVVLCHQPIDRWTLADDGRCPRCDEAQIYDIDPRGYERRTYAKPQAVLLKRDAVKAHRQLWEAAQRTDAVRLHYNREVSAHRTRHHAIYLDVPSLLGDQAFRDQALTSLREFLPEPPGVVLMPAHSGTRQLTELITDAWPGIPVPSYPLTPDMNQLRSDIADQVASSSNILLLDDAVVTGGAFSWLNRVSYRARQRTPRTPNTVHGFAVVLRPSSQATAKWVRRFLTGELGQRFGCAVELLIPGEQSCPWCAERRMLERWRDRLPGGHELIDARLERLSEPLDPPLLFGGDPADAGLMTKGSFLGQLDQRVAFAAFSAATWQQAQELDDNGYSGRRKYYSLELVFDAYYDTAFGAAAFRTLSTLQMRHAEQDAFITERLIAQVGHNVDLCYLSELAMAAATGKLPPEGVRRLLRDRASEPLPAMWLDVLTRMLGSPVMPS